MNPPHQDCEVKATKERYRAALLFHRAAHLSWPCFWSQVIADRQSVNEGVSTQECDH